MWILRDFSSSGLSSGWESSPTMVVCSQSSYWIAGQVRMPVAVIPYSCLFTSIVSTESWKSWMAWLSCFLHNLFDVLPILCSIHLYRSYKSVPLAASILSYFWWYISFLYCFLSLQSYTSSRLFQTSSFWSSVSSIGAHLSHDIPILVTNWIRRSCEGVPK